MFRDIQTKAPKDLVREYETKEGDKVKEYGPFMWKVILLEEAQTTG
jgi:HSP20 family protein